MMMSKLPVIRSLLCQHTEFMRMYITCIHFGADSARLRLLLFTLMSVDDFVRWSPAIGMMSLAV